MEEWHCRPVSWKDYCGVMEILWYSLHRISLFPVGCGFWSEFQGAGRSPELLIWFKLGNQVRRPPWFTCWQHLGSISSQWSTRRCWWAKPAEKGSRELPGRRGAAVFRALGMAGRAMFPAGGCDHSPLRVPGRESSRADFRRTWTLFPIFWTAPASGTGKEQQSGPRSWSHATWRKSMTSRAC